MLRTRFRLMRLLASLLAWWNPKKIYWPQEMNGFGFYWIGNRGYQVAGPKLVRKEI